MHFQRADGRRQVDGRRGQDVVAGQARVGAAAVTHQHVRRHRAGAGIRAVEGAAGRQRQVFAIHEAHQGAGIDAGHVRAVIRLVGGADAGDAQHGWRDRQGAGVVGDVIIAQLAIAGAQGRREQVGAVVERADGGCRQQGRAPVDAAHARQVVVAATDRPAAGQQQIGAAIASRQGRVVQRDGDRVGIAKRAQDGVAVIERCFASPYSAVEGEIPAVGGEQIAVLHLRRGLARAVATAVLPAGLRIPETVADAADADTHQAAYTHTRASHRTGRITLVGRAQIVADQPAHVVAGGRDGAAGVGIDDVIAIITADQAARIVAGSRHCTARIAGIDFIVRRGNAARGAAQANQAADRARAGDGAAGVTSADLAVIVVADQATRIRGAGHCGGGVTAGDSATVVVARQPPRVALACDGAAGMAVDDVAVIVLPDQSASPDAGRVRHRGVGITVDHGDLVSQVPGQATDIIALRIDRAIEVHAAGRTIEDRADQTAHIAARPRYGACGIAVVDSAHAQSGQGPHTLVGIHHRIRHRHVAHGAVVGAEQADIAAGRLVDAQAADGVAEAVERAGERQRHKTGATVPAAGGTGVDIAGQCIAAATATVDALQIEAGGAAGVAQRIDQGVADAIDRQQPRAGAVEIDAALEDARVIDTHQHILGDVKRRAAGIEVVARLHVQGRAAGGAHDGVDMDVAMRFQGQLVGVPRQRRVHMDIACLAAARLRLDRDIAGGQRRLQSIDADAARALRGAAAADREIDGVDQPGTAAARCRAGVDAGAVGHTQHGARSFDEAAIAALRRTGVELAGHLDGAALAQQENPPGLFLNGARTHFARVVDNGVEQAVGAFRRQHHQAAIGMHGIAIGHQRGQRRLVDGHTDQRAAVESQADLVAGRQRHRAQPGADHALIAHLRSQKRDVPAIVGVQAAQIGNGAALAAEAGLAGQEIGIAEIERTGHQARRIDPGALAEQHAVGIQDEHLAIRFERAVDHGAFIALDPVERDGGGIRLDEIDLGILADRKTIPLDGRLARGLGHGHRRTALSDVRLAGRHHGAAGQGRGGKVCRLRRTSQHHASQHAGQQRPRGAGALAPAAGIFCHDHDRVAAVVPYCTVNSIHVMLRSDVTS
ncbi:hypothetical protein D3C71_663000 [compost metagenome]